MLIIFLHLGGQTECRVKFQNGTNAQYHLPLGALERTHLILRTEHQCRGYYKGESSHHLLPAQAPYNDIVPVVTCQKLHAAKHQRSCAKDKGCRRGVG